MEGSGKDEIEILLEKLHSCGLQDNQTDPRTAEHLVVDIADHLSRDLSPVVFDLYLNHLFGDKGIVAFGRSAVKDKRLDKAKKGTLDIIGTLLGKNPKNIVRYVGEIRQYVFSLYNMDDAAIVRSTSLEVFCTLLERFSLNLDLKEMNVDQFIEHMCINIRSGKGSTVLQQQLKTLGMLLYCFPEQLSHQASLVLKVYKDQLIKHTGKTPDFKALAGVLQGLTLYLHHFPQGRDDKPELYQNLYSYIKKILNPDLNLPRRESQRACLEVIHKHGDKFSYQLFGDYRTIFTWLMKWCGHSNRDDRKAAVPAMDTFMVVIANTLDLQAGEEVDKKGKPVFKFLVQEYNRLLENNSGTALVSLAVKGYGLLSGACIRFLSEAEVLTMFNHVLVASQYIFYQSSEMLENKLSNLPSFLESLAIILNNMKVINDGLLDSVLQLALDLVENFPLVARPLNPLVYRALFSLFHTVYNKAEYFHDFVHSFVSRSILATCSHAPESDTSAPPGESGLGGSEKWRGLKNEITTYRSFLPFWKSLLLPEKVANVNVFGMPATSKTEISTILYSEFISCTLEITDKLDLETFKNNEVKTEDEESSEEAVTADPVSGLQAKTPKDFLVYMNLVSLVGEVLPFQSEDQLEQHVPRLLQYFVRQSLLQPLVSSHYSIITTVITCSRSSALFRNIEDPEAETVIHLIRSYIVELLQRCRQYRDQLLVSCLTLFLKLPNSIVIDIFPELVQPIQMALNLGVSYLPLAEVCVKALQIWSSLLPKDIVQKYFPAIMPHLLPYLRSQESGGQAEVLARSITVRMTLARQRRKVDQKKLMESKKVDESAMRKVQMSILRLIGSLDPGLSLSVIPQDPESIAAAAVRWDTVQHIKFAIPFEQTKIDIYLDDLLPNVIELAVSSSDRQTKVAASELLHSIIILMIGRGAQQSQETQEKYPMAPLYRHVFQAMLRLSCDPDQVTRQLFITLTYQTIHWFTKNRNFENPDSVILLDSIMDGIVNPNDPALRDISAQCLAEFVKWSCKNNRAGAISANVKSILKRLISFCKHPSAFKRLGGAMAWNSMYREFREDAKAVDIWTLELLTAFLTSLELAQADDPALGTHEQCLAAIKHVERIIKEKKEVFWKVSQERRVPLDLGDGTLEDLLKWLMTLVGKPKSLVRHKCLELIVSLAPHLKGVPSAQVFVNKFSKAHNAKGIVDIVEGGGEALLGIKHYPEPPSDNKATLLKDTNMFFEALLAALEGYTWFLGLGIIPAMELLGYREANVFRAVNHFIVHMSTSTIAEYVRERNGGERVLITPVESQFATKLKCTVVIRSMEFVMLILHNVLDLNSSDLKSIWTPQFFKMVTVCVMDPVSLGFDVKDMEVKSKLPDCLREILKVFFQKMSGSVSKMFISHLTEQLNSPSHDLSKLLPSTLSEKSSVSYSSKQALEGLQLLHMSGWLSKCREDLEYVASSLTTWIEGCLISKGNPDSATHIHLSHLSFLKAVIDLAFTLHPQVLHHFLKMSTSTEVIAGHSGKQIQKGTHVLNVLGFVLIPYFVKDFEITMKECIEILKGKDYQYALGFATSILNFLMKNKGLRKKYRVTVVQAFLNNWSSFSNQSMKLCASNESLLGILSLLLLIDGEGTIKNHILDADSDVMKFYKGLLTGHHDLQLKIKALKVLPFFLTMSEAVCICVGECLDVLSINNFPLQSTEFTAGGAKDREYHLALNEILTALELTKSAVLLGFIINLFCREEKHRYEDALQTSLEKFMKRQSTLEQVETLKVVYNRFLDLSFMKQNQRQNVMDQVLLPLLQQAGMASLERFLVQVIKDVMVSLSAPLSHRSDEQLNALITKRGSYLILQVMYSKLPREKVFAPGSEINAAFSHNDESGKELTKEVFRCATKISKGELRHDQTHAEARRVCACSAYNALIAVLVCVQNDLRFYTNFLFTENITKGEAIWECLIDCNIKHEFDVEVNFKPGSKKRFVALRQNLKSQAPVDGTRTEAGTVQYMASHYLSDSSLREDLSQFDFNNSVVLAMSQSGDMPERMATPMEIDGELMTLNLDRSDYNDHDIMANLTAVIHHMVNDKIMTLPEEGTRPVASDIPKWMVFIQQKLEARDTHRNVKLFLLRLMMNTSRVFASYAPHFVIPVLSCISDGILGDNINYFLSDLLVMLMNWGKDGIPEDSVLGRNHANRVLLHLCKNTSHTRADIFKYNLDVVRSVVESWKKLLTVPYRIIYSLMETVNGQEREVEAGLQLLGIMLANGLSPYTVGDSAEKSRCQNLLLKLMCDKMASIHGAASELLGLYLKFLSSQNEDSTDLEKNIVKKITQMMADRQSQALSCVYSIHKHYPLIVNRFINKLLNVLPKLYGIYRTRVLECLVSHSASLEDVFINLKEQNLLEILARKEASTQLVALQLVNAVMPRLKSAELLHFMPGISGFVNHQAPTCREQMYDVLFWIHDTYNGSTDEDGMQLESKARGILLQAVMEQDAILRQRVLNYWLEGSRNLELPQRLLHILRKIYSPESEDSFLSLATYILLEATSRSADYHRSIFDHPLTECKFREMKVSTAWQERHASLLPGFAHTQGSGDTSIKSYLSFTQGLDVNADETNFDQVQATQQRAFAETQAGASFNWVTESTFDTTLADMEYQATHAPTQGASTGLLFTVGSSEKRNMQRYKNPGIGNTRMQPHNNDSKPDEASVFQTKLIRRRFVRNQDREKQSVHFAKLEERRRKLRESLDKERKSRREAQVTMYRQYRVGELPDIQIQHKALIAPLQALAQRDGKIASKLFELLTQGVIDGIDFVNQRELEDWHQQMNSALNDILASSYVSYPQLLKTVLQLMINNDITVNPETLSAACQDSHLESLGILVLERQALLSVKQEKGVQPPDRKRMKRDAYICPDASLWLNMAELYKNLNLWDVTCGIVHEKLDSVKGETRRALEAEAANIPTQAFIEYRTALGTEDWEEDPAAAEIRIWEDCYIKCAGMLGQWSEMEKFVEDRFLKQDSGDLKLDQVWSLQRPISVLHAIIHSKLLSKILDGSECDGNLLEFINCSLENPHHRLILESIFPLQLAILSAHQQRGPQAESYLISAMSSTLHSLSQYSILTPKPLKTTLRNAQLLTELDDFLRVSKHDTLGLNPSKIKQTVSSWKNRRADHTDSPVLIQSIASYRDFYLQYLDNQMPEVVPEDFKQIATEVRATTHRSVVEAALQNNNYHLADRHLRKLKAVSNHNNALTQFYFLMTENHILRGKSNRSKRLQYLVEAWAKYMGKVSSMTVIDDPVYETQYLRIESILCFEICEAIKEMGNDWEQENKFMRVLSEKFPGVHSKESWYTELFKCSFNALKNAIDLTENKLSKIKGMEYNYQKTYMTMVKYCEECLENWKDNIDVSEYSKHLIISVLRGMAVGDSDAHFHFPRLISLLEVNPDLIETFNNYSGKVPVWMYLLWLSHILIYVDKTPGPALQSIVEHIAAEYPQALVYTFRISSQQYDLTTSAGKTAEAMCKRVEALLRQNSLFEHFTSAMSLLVAPYIVCKDALSDLCGWESNKSKIEKELKSIEENLLKINIRSSRGTAEERGEAYIKLDRMRKLVAEAFPRAFGQNMSKLKTMALPDIKKQLQEILKIFKPTLQDNKVLPRQLNAYSPWLSNFQSSRYSDTLELPGQYSGLSKPLPEYHIKISSFDENLRLMTSMRVPIRMTIRGDDEKEHKFLVKWGEDLRTDQRMEQTFVLMNDIYASSFLCSNTTSRPFLDTYQVIPLSLKVGLLEWVESTVPLKEFINDSYMEQEKDAYKDAHSLYNNESNWNPSKKAKINDVVKTYEKIVNKIPWDVLRRGIVKLASSSEGFFSLRSAFAVSYATLCISHWLLGIGDRHCSNFLVCLKTGRVIGIDFGHHFESSAQVLPFPELMPFRMTPQIANVFLPVGVSGMLKEIMVAALSALRNSHHLLMAVLEAFVKEPTEDWINFVRILEGSMEDRCVELYSNERIKLLKAKLAGINPAYITKWAVDQNKKVKNVRASLADVIIGKRDHIRADINKRDLSPSQQVDVLLSLASDPNILGRTWIGWDPFL